MVNWRSCGRNWISSGQASQRRRPRRALAVRAAAALMASHGSRSPLISDHAQRLMNVARSRQADIAASACRQYAARSAVASARGIAITA
jgi:hypothetical protein